MSMDGFIALLIIAVAVVFGILTYVIAAKRKKKFGIPDDTFDERQKIVRGRGFTIGFFTLFGCSIIIACLKESGIYLFENSITECLCLGFFSFAVVMTYLIWHGASITPRQEVAHDGTYILNIFLGSALTIMGLFMGIQKATIPSFVYGICLLYIGINQLAKRAWDKKHRKDSDYGEE